MKLKIITYTLLFLSLFIFNTSVSANDLISLKPNELDNGYNYINNYPKEIDSDITITDGEAVALNEFIIVGKIKGDGLDYYPYLAYLKNGKCEFEIKLTDYKRGIFNDLLIEDNKILVTGNYEIKGIETIVLLEYDFSGNLIKKIEFKSDNNSYSYKIHSLQNEYILIGATYSKNFYESGNTGIKSMVVIRIDKNDFDNNYVIAFGNSESLDYYASVNTIDSFYILAKSSGAGFFSDSGKKEFLLLIKMDYHLDSPEYISLTNTKIKHNSKMFIYQDHICFMDVEDDHIINITSYTKDLDFINTDYYTDYYLPNIISDFDCCSDGNYLAVSLYSKSNNKLYERRIIFDENFKEIFNEEYLHEILSTKKIYKYKNNLFFYIFKDDKYEISNSFYLKRFNDLIYINARTIEVKEAEEIDNSIYGKTNIEYVIDYNNTLITYSEEIEVKLETNIIPFSTYSQGVTLNFNAKGYLNGTEIASGTIVEEEGQYLLELLGNNNEKESIYFTVGKLSIETSEIKIIEDFAPNYLSATPISEETNFKSGKITTPITIQSINSDYNYYFLIVVGAIGIILGIIISKKWRKKDV